MMKNHMGYLPPMGWNSWNTFTWDINETLIKEVANAHYFAKYTQLEEYHVKIITELYKKTDQ